MDLCLSLDRKRRRGTVPVPVPVFVAQPVVAAFAHTVNRSTAQVLGDKLLMYTLQMGSQDIIQNQTVPKCRRLLLPIPGGILQKFLWWGSKGGLKSFVSESTV
jgi:hypothetical protein